MFEFVLSILFFSPFMLIVAIVSGVCVCDAVCVIIGCIGMRVLLLR